MSVWIKAKPLGFSTVSKAKVKSKYQKPLYKLTSFSLKIVFWYYRILVQNELISYENRMTLPGFETLNFISCLLEHHLTNMHQFWQNTSIRLTK